MICSASAARPGCAAEAEQYEERLAQSEAESRPKTTFLSRMSHEIRTHDERHYRHADACAADGGSAGSAHDERQPCDHPQSSRMVPWDIGGAVCLCAMELSRAFVLWHAERRRRRMSIEKRVRQSQKLIFKLISFWGIDAALGWETSATDKALADTLPSCLRKPYTAASRLSRSRSVHSICSCSGFGEEM